MQSYIGWNFLRFVIFEIDHSTLNAFTKKSCIYVDCNLFSKEKGIWQWRAASDQRQARDHRNVTRNKT